MFFQQLVNGLTIGSTYALVTIGFNLVYGVLELTNFAHSSFYMLGAYLTVFSMTWLLGSVTPLGFFIGLGISIIITGLLGAVMDKASLEPIRKRNGAPITALLTTVGVQTIINNSILLIFGTESKPFPDVFQLGKVYVGGTVIQKFQIIIFVVAILLMLGLSYLVYRTKIGNAMRAISQNATAAKLMGINVNTVITITFFIGSAVAAISGAMMGTYYQKIDTLMGASVGLKSISSAVLGGMGSLPGAMFGGFIIGILETMFAAYVGSGFRDAIAFIIMFVVLLIKPSGLLGVKIETKV